jgi:hypothetical protein
MKLEAYKRDLAYVHDVGFGSFAERAAPGVLSILRRGDILSSFTTGDATN